MENESDVIDLKRIFSLLWSNRKKFYKLWGLVFILTYGLLLFVPRYYTTTTRIAPELGSAMDMGSHNSKCTLPLGWRIPVIMLLRSSPSALT